MGFKTIMEPFLGPVGDPSEGFERLLRELSKHLGNAFDTLQKWE